MPIRSKVKKVLWIILFFNLLVLLIKIFTGVTCKSLSILGDAVHSAGDTINNVVFLAILKFAYQPPDKEHPYGHEKFETLGAFAIVIFLGIAAVEILQGAIDRLIHPVNLPLFRKEVVYLLLLTLVINIFVWFYERKKGLELENSLLVADSSHTASDVLITISVIGAQFFIAKKMYWIDPVLAIFISVLIIKAAYEIITNTVPILVDAKWHEPKEIINVIMSVNGVRDCYDVSSRKGPYSSYIECKIKVTPKDLYGAHLIADSVEETLKNKFGDCKITIHLEP